MGNLSIALQQLREERKHAQLQVEKLDTAISAIESLNGARASRIVNEPTRLTSASTGTKSEPTRVISAASRRRMAQAQRARWARARKESQPAVTAKTTASAPVKHTMSVAARRKIAAFQRARWAKVKAQQQKKAA
jgi:hypothetical protein